MENLSSRGELAQKLFPQFEMRLDSVVAPELYLVVGRRIQNQEWVEAVSKLAFPAPKARNVKAWAIGPGGKAEGSRALKARNVS